MAYSLTTSYAGESLLSGFNWFDGVDPSHGYVAYQNRESAQSMGLYSTDETTGVVRLGVDHTNKYSLSEGRPSIRLESKQAYNHGLFIADFLHMPPSQCGLWPAFWSYGNDWPNGGEIDIIEGVNTAHNNIMSAHTADGCTQSPSLAGLYTGEERDTDCAVGAENIGCGFNPPSSDSSSYGDGFNAVNGGVYAMKWDSQHISLWHFPRGSIPADVEAKRPDPDSWGLPQAIFGGSSSCDVDTYWKNMNIVININFCGDYGNGVWGKTDTCTDFAPTCPEYVASNPEAFVNAYWDVRYIDAYEFNPDAGNISASASASTTTSVSASTTAAEPTTTTTMTSLSTTTVTVGRTRFPANSTAGSVTTLFPSQANPASTASFTSTTSTTTIQPIATEVPVNPTKIGAYSYLGCFESNTNFPSFRRVADSRDMTLERCVELCGGKTYAGIFDSGCFCADDIDADTRASAMEGMCDHVCPGDDMEFCGGVIQHHHHENNNTTTNNNKQPPQRSSTVPYSSYSSSLSSAPGTAASAAPSGPRFNSFGNSTAIQMHARRLRLRRAASAPAPVSYALTVYGAVSDDKPAPPPAMAPGSNITSPSTTATAAVTSVAYVTVFPVPAASKPVNTKVDIATTLTTVVAEGGCDEEEDDEEDDDDDETPATTTVDVVMATTTVDCDEASVPTTESEVGPSSAPTMLLQPSLNSSWSAPILPPPPSPPPPPPPSPVTPVESPIQTTALPLPPSNVVVVAAAPGSFDEVKRSAVVGLAALALAMAML